MDFKRALVRGLKGVFWKSIRHLLESKSACVTFELWALRFELWTTNFSNDMNYLTIRIRAIRDIRSALLVVDRFTSKQVACSNKSQLTSVIIIMNYELWIMNCELWILNYEFWIMNSELSWLYLLTLLHISSLQSFFLCCTFASSSGMKGWRTEF